jgi:sec-independent protein translocase protein TatA
MVAVILFLDSLGGGEVMVIMLFILIFFGSDKIPGLAKGLGKGMREFKDAMNGIQSELKQNMADAENQVKKVKESLPEVKMPDLSEPFKAKPIAVEQEATTTPTEEPAATTAQQGPATPESHSTAAVPPPTSN